MTPEWIEQDWLKRWDLYEPRRVPLKDAASGREFTYRQLYQWSNTLAQELRTRFEVEPGDRIAILATNHWSYIPLFFACQRLGAALVPINFRLAPREIAHILKDCGPKVLLTHSDYTATAQAAEWKGLQWKLDGTAGLIEWLDLNPQAEIELDMTGDQDSLAMILYTSGTTGTPKGAMITRRMIFWNSINTTMRLDLTQNDVHIAFLPFFHTGGWNVLVTPFLHRGAKTILLDKFCAEKVLDLIEKEKVTILFGVPTMLDMMARSPTFPKAQLRSLRFAVVGGEPMPLDLIRTWQARQVPIRQGYGLTEFGPNVFSLSENDSERKLGSIGFPNFYIEAKVVDQNGNDVDDDSVGELILRGPMCMPGYWRNAEATHAAIQNGWLHTGDLVRRDQDGYYYVVGRKKDMYISGGENVYPAEIEQWLRQHPQIQEAAVIGTPDEKWGESGLAFVVTQPGAQLTSDQVLEFCRGQLARYKIPKAVRFVTELPKGDSGKVLKRNLLSLVQETR